jgi:hypothetical protein
MKTFLPLVLIFISTVSFGQFLDKTNKWNDLKVELLLCQINCGGRISSTHSYSLTSDTTIGEKKYVVLLDTIYVPDYINKPAILGVRKAGWLREDNKKIFYLAENGKYTTDTLIYDFNLKVNAEFNINSLVYTVIKTDTVEYYGTKRNTIYLKNTYDSLTWIDGIGATRGLLYFKDHMPEEMLLCFKQNNNLQYKNDQDKDCIYIDILENVKEISKPQITISPNPALNIVSIVSDKKISHIEILSVSGKIINTYKPNKNDYTIDISDLPKGVYFIKINNETKKIIKE